ncbi:intermembrane transport protein PqiB [Rhodopila sp.]|uniref:PqiB family protein n=1 Tax=Rhodopila sp. TaxID=2480087 RepID=UPI003D0C199D
MSERHPTAVVRSPIDHKRRLPLIWAIPVVTLIIGAWLAWSTLSQRGPLITVTFETAEGLQADQSHVRHKDVDMGVVQKIGLTPDLKRVQVTIRMNREAEPLLTDGAQFWVVRPRFFAGAISGLQTLFSGSYIDLLPAQGGGQPKRDFVGLENPPVLQSDVPGRTFLLRAKRIGSLNLGSPILFRDLEVGEVLGWDVGEMARNITVHIFVRAPFDKYVDDNTRFWNASGAKVALGANGLQVKLQSLRAVVLGALAFDTPDDPKTAGESAAEHSFPLYEDEDAADSSTYKRTLPFIANFESSVSGLGAGSPVTLHGLKIGEVSSLSLMYDRASDTVVAPVHFTVEPERIAMLELPTGGDLDKKMQALVNQGLRVKLESSNILTGSKQLSMDVYPDAGPGTLGKQGDAYVIPIEGGSADDVATAATNLVNRLNSIPFESIGQNLDHTLAGVNALVNDKQLAETVGELRSTLAGAQQLIGNLNHGLKPAMQRLPSIANGLDSTVQRTDKLLASLQSGYGTDSRFNRDVGRTMDQLSDAARSIRVLADLLARHPEALIRGRTDQGVQ